MKHLQYIMMGVCLLCACSEQQEYRDALSRAEAVMNDRPDSALLILDSLGQHEKEFGNHFLMQYRLHRLNAQNKTNAVFTSDSLAKALVEHFDRHGTANERVQARYLLGRAYCDMGEAPRALQTYFDAISVADTLNEDCNYDTLKGIYGQMATIFHLQNLPHDEIWAIQHYIDCIRRTGNAERYIAAKSQLIRPYYLLGEKDSVLQIINESYHSLKQLGRSKRAASVLPTSIYIYIERQDLVKAKEVMDIFEQESGLFDEHGNITQGREGYYFVKGFYELASHQLDSADFYFRRAIQYGHLSEGYRGLLSVYKEKHDIDSVVRFAHLFEAAQDTLHNQMQTNAIHQMSALYNYNRSQREAEQERAKAQEVFILLGYIILIAIGLLLIIIVISWLYRKKQKEKLERIVQLEDALNTAKLQRNVVQEELRRLKEKDYEGMIAEKEKTEAELTLTIEQLQKENDMLKKHSIVQETDRLDDFLASQIAELFVKKAENKTERPKPSDAEWNLLMSEFSKKNPITYKSFGKGRLSPLEQRICILVILDISEKNISRMTNSVASTVSNAKSRANEKLYQKKDASSLKNNLIHAIRRS